MSALAPAHVDENELGTPDNNEGRAWEDAANLPFENKFGKVKRVSLPLKRCGIQCTKLPYGYRMDQDEYCQQIKPAAIEQHRLKDIESLLTKYGGLSWNLGRFTLVVSD